MPAQEEKKQMKLVCYVLVGGVETAKAITTFGTEVNCASFVKSIPGVGKPFLVFASLPPGTLMGAEFEDVNTPAPIVSTNVQENLSNIQAMLANPTPYLSLLTII